MDWRGAGTQFTCSTGTKVLALLVQKYYKRAGKRLAGAGTQFTCFTCFTGTKVQTLTPEVGAGTQFTCLASTKVQTLTREMRRQWRARGDGGAAAVAAGMRP